MVHRRKKSLNAERAEVMRPLSTRPQMIAFAAANMQIDTRGMRLQ